MMVIRAACILAALSAAAADHVRAEIPIGFSSALTGPYAWLSELSLAGTELAIADLNAKGGVLGEPLEPIVVDDGCDAELAPLAAEKLVSEAVAVVFSVTCSGAAIPASKVYRRAGIPMIEAGATNPRLTQASEAVSSVSLVATIFRALSAAITWQTAGEIAISRLCTILRPMAKGLLRKSKRLNQRGVSEVLFATYPPGAMDFSDLLEQLRAASIEVLYLGATVPRQASSFVKPATGMQCPTGRRGLSVYWRVLAGGRPGRRGPCSRPSAIPPMSRVRLRSWGASKGNSSSQCAALYSYAAVQLWAQAVEKAGTVEPKAVAAALHANQFDTVLGTIGFDEKGDVTGYEPFVWYVWRETPPVDPLAD